ncbi:hypothetical protein [Pontibacter flavimaris]|uniref:hypothetical protein n=1 Tax=Pontibacter flavimaris TaxID=1797110 RepID=UPI001115294A|nr:hypothetical protein [Pontibacter flavimaris]
MVSGYFGHIFILADLYFAILLLAQAECPGAFRGVCLCLFILWLYFLYLLFRTSLSRTLPAADFQVRVSHTVILADSYFILS